MSLLPGELQVFSLNKLISSDNFYIAVEQIFSHLYAEMLLDMRLAFREAKICATKGIYFYHD